MPDEVEVYFGPDFGRVGLTRFGMVGRPPVFCGGWLCNEVPPIRIDSADGSWIWELFPATFSDGRNNEPSCYVAVWRD